MPRMKDRFAATELAAQLQKEWEIKAVITAEATGKSIILTHKGVPKSITGLPEKKALQGYQLTLHTRSGDHQGKG